MAGSIPIRGLWVNSGPAQDTSCEMMLEYGDAMSELSEKALPFPTKSISTSSNPHLGHAGLCLPGLNSGWYLDSSSCCS